MKPAEFKKRREALGLSQAALAAFLDLNRGTIVRYESGFTPVPKVVEMALGTLISNRVPKVKRQNVAL